MSKQSFFYQELQTMLEKPGCPLCHVGHKAGRLYLENLLWGSVNDRDTRARLDQELGFCGQHSRDLLTFSGERLGTAIIQQAMLKEALRRLQRADAPGRRSLSRRLQAALGRDATPAAVESPLDAKGICSVCQHMWRLEQRSLEELVEHLVGDLDAPLAAAGGLCWPHLERGLALCEDEDTFASLVALQAENWQTTIAHLGEFIRKRDYRFSDEPVTEDESNAMTRSMAILTGEYPVP